MKSTFLWGFTALLLCCLIACNKQSTLTETPTAISDEQVTIVEDMANEIPDDIPWEEGVRMEYLGDDAQDAEPVEGQVYCVYEILSIVGPRKRGLAPGSILCVDCPAPPTCPGNHYLTMYEIYDAMGRAAYGDMMLITPPDKSCIDCPDNGNKGYQFL